MLGQTLVNNEEGQKWEVYKTDANNYTYKYFELYNDNWRIVFSENNYSKDAIEYELDIVSN